MFLISVLQDFNIFTLVFIIILILYFFCKLLGKFEFLSVLQLQEHISQLSSKPRNLSLYHRRCFLWIIKLSVYLVQFTESCANKKFSIVAGILDSLLWMDFLTELRFLFRHTFQELVFWKKDIIDQKTDYIEGLILMYN